MVKQREAERIQGSATVDWQIDEAKLKKDMRIQVKKFTKRHKLEVRKALKKLGQEEKKLLREYMKGKGGRAAAVGENAYFQTAFNKDSNDYPVLEIGVTETLPSKGRGSANNKGFPTMDLAKLLHFGGKKPKAVRSEGMAMERYVWFGNNWPGMPKTLDIKLIPGKEYGEAVAKIPFLKVRQQSVERKLPERINDALAKTAKDLRREQGKGM